jgi:hypothetical protein
VKKGIGDLYACESNRNVKRVFTINKLHLLSSIHTLGYIEFDDLCNLDCLEERIFAYVDLPRLSEY